MSDSSQCCPIKGGFACYWESVLIGVNYKPCIQINIHEVGAMLFNGYEDSFIHVVES